MSKSSRKLLENPADVEAAFYRAVERADLNALMALWADEEEIVCIHPETPRLVGYAAIRASWEAIFARGGVSIRSVQTHITQNLMTAVHSMVEEVNDGGKVQQIMHILATHVYMKTPLGWRIVLRHVSTAPGKVTMAGATATIH